MKLALWSGGLFDLTVSFSDAPTLNVELKVDASLGFEQMKRQMAHTAKSKERLLFILLGTTQYSRSAKQIESFRETLSPLPAKELITVVDLDSTAAALRSLRRSRTSRALTCLEYRA